MKKKGAVIVLSALGLLALIGSGPCDQAELDDQLNTFGQFLVRTLQPGDVVDVFDKLAYWVGEDLNPTSIDMFNVVLRRIDNPIGPVTTDIPGIVEGFDFSLCGTSGYVMILEITSFSNFDLGTTSGWVNIRLFNGQDIRVYVPTDASGQIEAFQTLALYVAADGSTYYALNDTIFPDANPYTHDMSFGLCSWVGLNCPSLTPAMAYNPANLAAAASAAPSITPLLLQGNSIEPGAGLNGGLLGEITNDVQVFVMAIDSCPPYFGYDQLSNTFDFLLGGYDLFSGYLPGFHAYLDPLPVPLAYPNGVVFSPYNLGTACDLNPNSDFELILQNVQRKDGSVLPTITVPFSTGDTPPGYVVNPCVP